MVGIANIASYSIPNFAKGYLGTLVKSPFQNFSKAKGKDGCLACHQKHDYHQDAMVRGKSFLDTYIRPESRIDTI